MKKKQKDKKLKFPRNMIIQYPSGAEEVVKVKDNPHFAKILKDVAEAGRLLGRAVKLKEVQNENTN